MPWGDAVAIIRYQKPADSAVYRELYPDMPEQNAGVVDRLEFLAVLLVRHTLMSGNQTEISEKDLPAQWADLFQKRVEISDEVLAAQMAAIDRLQGR